MSDQQRAALVAIRTLRAKLDALERAKHEPIAIVGLACRFPGAADADAFWRLLADGRDAVRPIPAERFDVDALFDANPDARGTTYTRWAGLVDGIADFDDDFFGIAPREAEQTDPQQRMFLECTWAALEHAGMAPSRLRGSATGVFVGVTASEYAKLHDRDVALEDVSAYAVQGYASNAIAGRVSHVLDLHGPSVAIDTACSSSLVAVDRACRSLRDGETTLAIAGGVNALAVAESLVAGSRWGMFSRDGRCKAFAAAADGFVRAEGCGVIVLKRLSRAQADGDRVLAVILGSAVNHDGRSAGLTVPNASAQQAVVRGALAAAGVDPAQVGYVEAHGTGTALGDPIEAEALGAVFGAKRSGDDPVLIGSVKTNVGHLESAAGIAGLIKVVLAMRHGTIPAQLHFDEPSPRIRWDALPLRVVDTARAWQPIGGRRIAGVSAFSFSGTNAHVVLADAPGGDAAAPRDDRPTEILVVSARSESALRTLAARYADALDERAADWRDIVHTAAVGRDAFAHRIAVRGGDAETIAASLRAFAGGRPDARTSVSRRPAKRPAIAFAFTGQGAQYAGMGRDLAARFPIVRAVLDRADALLRDRLDVPLGAVMRGEHPDAAALLAQTRYTQPALYTLEYALVELYRALGIEADACIGHSVGEYAAAAASGVFGFEDGLLLIADRASLMQAVDADGAMVAVAASERDVAPLLADESARVAIAAVNAPDAVTISGARDAVARVADACAQRGWRTAPLPVSHAFHSPLLDGVGAALEERASHVRYGRPDRVLISNLTGAPIERLDAAYWRAHAREAVRFADGVRALASRGCDVLVEIGPKPTLLPLARRTLGGASHAFVASLRSADTDADALAQALQALYAAGVDVDWGAWDRNIPRRIVDVPSYPFERRRHWLVPSQPGARARPSATTDDALLGTRVRSALADAHFETVLSAHGDGAWVGEHRVGGQAIAPATVAVELMLRAGASVESAPVALRDLAVRAPLRVDEPQIVQTVIARAGDAVTARVFVAAAGDPGARFALHAQARLTDAPPERPVADLAALRARCGAAENGEALYERLEACGIRLGPVFRRTVRTWRAPGEALAEVDARGGGTRPHPAVLDACVHAAASAFDGTRALVPFACDRIHIVAAAWPETVFAHARAVDENDTGVTVDVDVYDAAGAPLASFEHVRFASTADDVAAQRDVLYETRWVPEPPAADTAVAAGGRWLLVDDAHGFAPALADALTTRGATCTVVARPSRAELTAELARGDVRAVVDCRALDAPGVHLDVEPQLAQDSLTALYAQALDVLHVALAREAPPAVVFVSAGSAPIDGIAASATHDVLAALAKSAVAERPELTCRTIDLDDADRRPAATLARELLSDGEPVVAYRAERRYVPRLVPVADAARGDDAREVVAWCASPSGVVDDAPAVARPRRAPAAHEIEIDVRANGLNFRDALQALAMLPGAPRAIGYECSGVVRAAGAASGFAGGDAVMAYAPGGCASGVIVPAAHAVRIPANTTFAQAASLPIVAMTALYALEGVAALGPGQSILIHAAAGGLGTVAVQLARAKGATVYATAGSPRKRAAVRALGVEAVMDSRAPGFGAEIAARTNGRGVDVVLNSLAGALAREGLNAVARGGRFIEVGKRDVLTADEARALRPDVAYTAFELGAEGERDATLIPRLLARTRSLIEDGSLTPPPITAYPFADARRALDDLAHARRIGKIVLTHDARDVAVDANGAYLVTGGFGAVGTLVATWLAGEGARTIVLVGRRLRDDARPVIDALRARGVDVHEVVADVADTDAMRVLVASLRAPLRGVVHCAGTLADGTLSQQTPAMFETAAAPKVAGTLALHRALAGAELDFFVLFSSASAILGSTGQAAYAAANAAMTAIARGRRAAGLPATAVAWGPWEGRGMAATASFRRRAEALRPFDARTGFAALRTALARGAGEPLAVQVTSWARFASASPAAEPMFGAIGGAAASARTGAAPASSLRATLAACDAATRRRLLREHVERTVATILGLPADERIAPDVPLHDRGLDSLLSIELRNALAQSVGVRLAPTVALDYPTLPELVDHLLVHAFPDDEREADSTAFERGAIDPAAIAALSDEEAEALLQRELESADV